jgi:hypothetical protein
MFDDVRIQVLSIRQKSETQIMIQIRQRFGSFRAMFATIAVAIFAVLLAADALAGEAPPSNGATSDDRADSVPVSPEAEDKDPSKPRDLKKPPQKRETGDDLDRQLLRDLLPDLPLELNSPDEESVDKNETAAEPQSRMPFADELDVTVASMREVSRRLDKLNLSDDTEQLQTGIVTNIDALIEKLRKLPPPSSSSSSQNSDEDQSDSESTSQGQKKEPKQSPQQSPQNQQGADSSSGSAPQPKTGKAGESTEQNLRQARERAAALARRRALIDEVWGHLPPAMRERLLNVGSEKLLPKYEGLIRRYYEALAEPDRADSRR